MWYKFLQVVCEQPLQLPLQMGVTAKYLGNKFVKPLIERHKAEGRAEGIAAGRAEGESEERRRWTEWNSRRLEAERGGVPFDEPPPSA